MANRRFNLDALGVFDVVMRTNSFSAAALELNVTASAVSQRIKTLEQSLGVQLFERLPHGLKPTGAARLYLLELRPALERLQQASMRVATSTPARRGGRSRLSVDVLPALASTRLVPSLDTFLSRFPDVELRLTSSTAVSDPGRDGYDCCIRYGPGGWEGVDAVLLAHEDVFPVCSPRLLERGIQPNDLESLARAPVIHDLMPVSWVEWMAAFGGPEVRAGGPTFSDSSLALRSAVEGFGVALGRSCLVQPDLASGRLVRLFNTGLRSPFAYWLVRPAGRVDRLVELFHEWLMEDIFGGPEKEQA